MTRTDDINEKVCTSNLYPPLQEIFTSPMNLYDLISLWETIPADTVGCW